MCIRDRFDPDMAQQQMDMMDDMSMSAKEYAEYWTDSCLLYTSRCV